MPVYKNIYTFVGLSTNFTLLPEKLKVTEIYRVEGTFQEGIYLNFLKCKY
jgi:hypothetical protein